jgi:hypothetical protein
VADPGRLGSATHYSFGNAPVRTGPYRTSTGPRPRLYRYGPTCTGSTYRSGQARTGTGRPVPVQPGPVRTAGDHERTVPAFRHGFETVPGSHRIESRRPRAPARAGPPQLQTPVAARGHGRRRTRCEAGLAAVGFGAARAQTITRCRPAWVLQVNIRGLRLSCSESAPAASLAAAESSMAARVPAFRRIQMTFTSLLFYGQMLSPAERASR